MADELPLLSQPDKRRAPNSGASRGAVAVPAAASAAAAGAGGWRAELAARWDLLLTRVVDEARSLVRVTRIDQPEAMLIAPEQAYFLRENLKLRLLNARLALLSRQFNTAQSDLREVQLMLERYFDRSSKRVTNVSELVRQVSAQARGIVVPRPDETFAALSAVLAGK
jgi:uroporphyrin-3 C-methyltransferase